MNKTVIIDPDGQRCFIMPLDRSEIPRPKNLFEVIRNMKNGLYNVDVEEVQHDTRVILPPIPKEELYTYGLNSILLYHTLAKKSKFCHKK